MKSKHPFGPPMMMLCLAVLGNLVLNKPVWAQGRDYIGVGGETCGVWVDARKRNGTHAHQNWVLGYFSALNLWRVIGRDKDALKDIHAKAIYQWLDNYCQANPLETIATAARDLARELDRRAH